MDIKAIWKSEDKGGSVDYDADLAQLEHEAKGSILQAEGAVRNAKKGLEVTIAKSRGKIGSFEAIINSQSNLADAEEALEKVNATYKALFEAAE